MEKFKKGCSFFVAIIILFLLATYGYLALKPREYVRGKDGTKCYIEGQEHGNIDLETALYFNSIEECLNSKKSSKP